MYTIYHRRELSGIKQGSFEIIENTRLAEDIYRLGLSGNVSEIKRPGQFINLKLDGFFLRRPLSVFRLGEDTVSVIYKTVGEGTVALSLMKPGQCLDVLTGLGNGFDTEESGNAPLLVGGGVGIPPLYFLAQRLLLEGKNVTAVLGFNKASEIFCVKDFEDLGLKPLITTADGSCGIKGLVTDALPGLSYSYLYCCGPEPMLKALYFACDTDAQFCFERRMGCGFGVCMGCSCKTLTGSKRICKDGPVLKKEEILWQT